MAEASQAVIIHEGGHLCDSISRRLCLVFWSTTNIALSPRVERTVRVASYIIAWHEVHTLWTVALL